MNPSWGVLPEKGAILKIKRKLAGGKWAMRLYQWLSVKHTEESCYPAA